MAIATALTMLLVGLLILATVACISVDDPFDTLPIWVGERYHRGLEICGPSRYREFEILDLDKIQSDTGIDLGLDGSHIAGIFSDGRIVIWDKLDVVAEYASYRSMLDYYAANP